MAYQDTVLARSPYVFWRMGGVASPVQDETATNIDLSVNGGATFGAAGPVAAAVTFDGTDDYAQAASLNLSTGDQVTFEAWVKFASYTDDDSCLCEFAGPWA